jgi:hypothetical protein
MDTKESDLYSHECAKLANIHSLQDSTELAWPLLWVKGIPHLSSELLSASDQRKINHLLRTSG